MQIFLDPQGEKSSLKLVKHFGPIAFLFLMLINNSRENYTVKIGDHTTTIKARSIVEYFPPKLKSPVDIFISKTKNKTGNVWECKVRRGRNDVFVFPNEC